MLEKSMYNMGEIIKVPRSDNNRIFDTKTNDLCANNKDNTDNDKSFLHIGKYSIHHFAYLQNKNDSGNYVCAGREQIHKATIILNQLQQPYEMFFGVLFECMMEMLVQ